MRIRCLLGKHDWQIISYDVGVIESKNPYSTMGQHRVCALRRCMVCEKEQVCGKGGPKYTKNGSFIARGDWLTGEWTDVIDYQPSEHRMPVHSNSVSTFYGVIEEGTPIIRGLKPERTYRSMKQIEELYGDTP